MLSPTSPRQLSFRRAADRALKVVGRAPPPLSQASGWSSLSYPKLLIAPSPVKVSSRNPFGKISRAHLDPFIHAAFVLSVIQ